MNRLLRLLGVLLGTPSAEPTAAAPPATGEVGCCADVLVALPGISTGHSLCSLPAGHAGWHRDSDSEAKWTR